MSGRWKGAVAGFAIAVALVAVTPAFAGSPTNHVYPGTGTQVQSAVGTFKPPKGPKPPASTSVPAATSTPTATTIADQAPVSTTAAEAPGLPFTGLDLTFIVIAGIALLAMGFGLRRISRKS